MIAVGVIVTVAAMDALEAIAAPVVLALVTGVVLSPLSYFWERHGLPSSIGALIGLVGTLVITAGLVLIFQPVVSQLIDQAPKVWADMQQAIDVVQGLVRGIEEARGEVEKAVAAEPNVANLVAAPKDAPSDDGLPLPSVSDALLLAPAILSRIVIFAGVLFFFLLTRRDLYEWMAKNLPGGNAARSAETLREAERLVSRYFLTVTLINAGLGFITAAMLHLYGMPGAVSLGVVAFLLNFILYLGPAIFFCALLFAGVGTFDGVMVLLPALTFLGLNATEGQIVTPTLVGRHMQLNPLLVFLALVFGIWLWGPLGGIVAIPLALWLLVIGGVLPLRAKTDPEPLGET
ncbi:Predicted PurR-regulated permease PerM [Sedimentitalea nanhaiensis]|uniref:Predicted PurR-regulated permease PerM n=2 Tax=Sedimentitalea nanhaiensis TaxID=999627 RepID=A0A1I7BGY9_9RHOB|nr:Predicted PurR-regulated permease PerM [Sedimentitalea nanhaiensis]